MPRVTIALDAMGGDHGPSVIIPGALLALKKHPKLNLILVGDRDKIKSALQAEGASDNPHLTIKEASEVVAMDESPSMALRYKKDSSMRVAINSVKEGQADACVSAGNTGALMATARFVLKTIPAVDRPAIIAVLPSLSNHGESKTTRMLDLGANVDSKAEHLQQFAIMGSLIAEQIDNIPNPRVGLLNIGEEEIKGNEQVKQTNKLLEDTSCLNYIGYIEADDIYRDAADVIVCDGFIGNIALKSSEGSARLIAKYIKLAFTQNIFTKLIAVLASPVLKNLQKRFDPSRFNGASLVGLQGIVIKSHGGADKVAFANAIFEAIKQVEHNVPQKIHDRVSPILEQGEPQ